MSTVIPEERARRHLAALLIAALTTVCFVTCLIGPVSASESANEVDAPDLDVASAMQLVVAEIRASLPVHVDEDTTMVDVTFDQFGLTYWYELSSTRQKSERHWRARLETRSPEITSLNCMNPTVTLLLSMGYRVDFRYSKDGSAIWVLQLVGDACAESRTDDRAIGPT